jgi:Zn-dependent protease with chaperone function
MSPGVFALPAKTSFRFALLIVAVLTSSGMIYEAVYFATPRGAALATLIRVCQARALATHPQGVAAYAAALARARACRAGGERAEGWWTLLGIGVLAVLAGAIYWAQPWWYRRHSRLVPLTSEEAPGVIERLEELRGRAGVGPVTWLQQPLNFQPSAFAFGRIRRSMVTVSGGAVVAQARHPAVFDAIVLHELGHIRNRDIGQTYLAVAIWRAFVVASLLPMAVLLIFGLLGPVPSLTWRALVLALLVYLLRNSILRAREFDADARVAELDPDTSLGQVLADQPPRRGRQLWHLGWVHPSGRDRAAALLDPAPLYRSGFWDGLAIGLVAAMGAEAGQQLVNALVTPSPRGGLLPAFVFAFFSGGALTVAMWRMRLLPGATATAADWAAGLGLGLGVALGPVITLATGLDRGVAPDSWHTGAFIVLALWVLLVTALFGSVPAWIGRWADAWQQRDRRVPARGGMAIAAVGAWVTVALGLDLVLSYFTLVEEFGASTKIVLEQTWTTFGYDAARTMDAWVISAVFIAVPVTGYIASARRRLPRAADDTARRPRTWLGRGRPVALICLAGLAAVIAVTLATAAVAHARIALAIRWNGGYFASFLLFEEQMVVLVAVLVALIAAAVLTYELSDTIAIVVAAVIGALGIAAMMGSLTLGNCVAPFSSTYDHPPASDCPGDPGFLTPHIFPAAIEAALIGILVIPAAHYAGILIARRARLSGRPRRRVILLRWLAAVVAAGAVIAGVAVRVPDASAHGIQPIGTAGRDGWISGPGYQLRLFPNWYRLTRNISPGFVSLANDATFGNLPGVLVISAVAVSPSTTVRVPGARLVSLDRVRALRSVLPDYRGHFYIQWIAIRDDREYTITFQTIPVDYSSLSFSLTAMINSWHWNSAAAP